MTQISRRALLRSATLAPVAFAAGCNPFKSLTDANVQNFIDNFTAISAFVLKAEPAVEAIGGISSATVKTVNTVMSGIKAGAVEALALVTTTAGLPLVQRLEAGVADVATQLAGYKLPPVLKTILDDAVLVMPLLKTAVGLLVPAAGDPAASAAAMLRIRAAVGRA